MYPPASSLAFSPDGDFLLVKSKERFGVAVIDLRLYPAIVRRIPGFCVDPCISPDSNFLVGATGGGLPFVLNLRTMPEWQTEETSSPTGEEEEQRTVPTVDITRSLCAQLVQPADRTVVGSGMFSVQGLALSPDGRYVVAVDTKVGADGNLGCVRPAAVLDIILHHRPDFLALAPALTETFVGQAWTPWEEKRAVVQVLIRHIGDDQEAANRVYSATKRSAMQLLAGGTQVSRAAFDIVSWAMQHSTEA